MLITYFELFCSFLPFILTLPVLKWLQYLKRFHESTNTELLINLCIPKFHFRLPRLWNFKSCPKIREIKGNLIEWWFKCLGNPKTEITPPSNYLEFEFFWESPLGISCWESRPGNLQLGIFLWESWDLQNLRPNKSIRPVNRLS